MKLASLCRQNRRVGVDSLQETFAIAIGSQARRAPQLRGEQLRAAIEQGLITITQTPFQVSAPGKLIDNAASDRLYIRGDILCRSARVSRHFRPAAIEPLLQRGVR